MAGPRVILCRVAQSLPQPADCRGQCLQQGGLVGVVAATLDPGEAAAGNRAVQLPRIRRPTDPVEIPVDDRDRHWRQGPRLGEQPFFPEEAFVHQVVGLDAILVDERWRSRRSRRR